MHKEIKFGKLIKKHKEQDQYNFSFSWKNTITRDFDLRILDMLIINHIPKDDTIFKKIDALYYEGTGLIGYFEDSKLITFFDNKNIDFLFSFDGNDYSQQCINFIENKFVTKKTNLFYNELSILIDKYKLEHSLNYADVKVIKEQKIKI